MIPDIEIEPVEGDFDLEEIEAALIAMPHVSHDPSQAMKFMLAPDAETLATALANRKVNNFGPDFSVALVTLSPRAILVSFRDDRVLAPRAFVAWLKARRPIRIRDEDNNDVTALLDQNPDLIFGPKP